MRRLLMLGMLSLAAAACGPSRAEVEVDWTFGGLSCADAGVDRIEFAIAGEVLSPDHFSCSQATVGASLGSFLDGNYQLTVSGFDTAGNLVYQTTQTIQVRGTRKNVFPIDLPQVAQFTGDVTLHWTFGGRSCTAAGIPIVHVSVDNQVITDVNNSPDLPCTSAGVDGTTIGPLSQGQHTFDIVGVDGAGNSKYALNGFLVTVVAGQNTVASPDLAPAAPTTASANLTWTFGGQSCAAANVDHVAIFVDPAANGTGGVNAGTVPCSTAGTDGGSVDGLTRGTHSFAIQGIRTLADGPHLIYRTHNPPSSFFEIGLITDLSVSAELLP
ncbi:MAG TPA: hypothetical protein VIR81_00735 [Myxococcales bacterium]|nr:hypothetical protein [Myxococcales bacterium]